MTAAAELEEIAPKRSPWLTWLTRAFSFGLLALALSQFGRLSLTELRRALPDTPWFAVVLLALYFALPVADWIIFRRLWRLPWAGFPILMGKRIMNELLLIYSGDAYFYLWVRKRVGRSAAPLGVIKDVNILSALAGNVLALVLLVAAWPFLGQLHMGRYAGPAAASAAAMLAGTLVILLLNRRLFTLSRRQLVWVSGVHLARLVAGVALSAALWALALPGTTLGLLLALSTVRLLISRLPLVHNKELLFAAAAVFLAGDAKNVAAVIALSASAIMALHLALGGALALWAVLSDGRGPVWGRGQAPGPQRG